jgi:hypothetical protein
LVIELIAKLHCWTVFHNITWRCRWYFPREHELGRIEKTIEAPVKRKNLHQDKVVLSI